MGANLGKIRLLTADRHPLLRLGIRHLAEHVDDIEVMAEAANEEDTTRVAEELQPDVLLLGMNLPAEASVAVARHLCEAESPVRVLALSGETEEDHHFFEMLAWRAAGYRSKLEPPEATLQAIRAVARGKAGQISPRIAERVAGRTSEASAGTLDALTKSEQRVLRLIGQGWRNRQIAEMLSVAPDTVKNHITHLYAKLDVRSRGEAVRWAWRHGLGS